jgi:hypothetical protein
MKILRLKDKVPVNLRDSIEAIWEHKEKVVYGLDCADAGRVGAARCAVTLQFKLVLVQAVRGLMKLACG